MPPAGVPGLGDLAAAAGALKRVRRQGWVDRGVADAESVADHSYRVALLAWALARTRGLDAGRAMLIGLVHDLAEAEVGDETPYDALLRAGQPFDRALFDRLPPDDPVRRAAKQARERAAIERLAAALPPGLADELVGAWSDYADGQSPESRLVKELDRIETLRQAEEYAADQPDLPIGSFRRQVAAMALPEDLAALVGEQGRGA
jgi:putative hydrolase of HD superfamily